MKVNSIHYLIILTFLKYLESTVFLFLPSISDFSMVRNSEKKAQIHMSASEASLPHSSLSGCKQIYLEETLEILLGKLSLSLFKVYAISFLLDYVTYPGFRDTI